MIHKEWITNVSINSDDTVDVDFIDGVRVKYSDRDDIKEIFLQVGDQELRLLNREDMVEATY